MKLGPTKLLKNQRGMAILMVMASVTLLAFVLADFTFETFLNKVRVYNQEDKSQARLNAMSGLHLSMARLRFYQEGRNMLEKNTTYKKNVKHEVLNMIWSVPFIYPIPINKKMNVQERTIIQEFLDNTVINGGMQVTVQNASQLLNLNLLRVHLFRDTKKKTTNEEETSSESEGEEGNNPLVNIEKKLIEMFTKSYETKLENDDDFALRYGNINPTLLIKSIKYYVNPENSYEDEDLQDVQQIFFDAEMKPKFAPLTSLSELYLIPGWDDDLVDLIKNEVTVHGNMAIDLNKITDKLLKLILPDLDDEYVAEFFKYRDDPDDPHFINDIEDFKAFFINEGIFGKEYIDERIAEFQKAGITFGGSSNIFKVMSTGTKGRATYTINAWVVLPVKPPPPPEKKKKKKEDNKRKGQTVDENGQEIDTKKTPAKKEKKKKRVIQFLLPRIVEIIAN